MLIGNGDVNFFLIRDPRRLPMRGKIFVNNFKINFLLNIDLNNILPQLIINY